jgi:hypothetical protein
MDIYFIEGDINNTSCVLMGESLFIACIHCLYSLMYSLLVYIKHNGDESPKDK